MNFVHCILPRISNIIASYYVCHNELDVILFVVFLSQNRLVSGSPKVKFDVKPNDSSVERLFPETP